MSGLPIRVTVLDTWETLPLEVTPETTVSALLRQALAGARVRRDPADYVLKFRGAAVDGAATLAAAGIGPNASLIVLPRRRIPAK